MTQPGVQLASIDEQKSLTQQQQQEFRISGASQAHSRPCPDLLTGTRMEYIEIGIPLYEASMIGDWKAAKEILVKRPELVRYSITENYETALHVAASTKCTKQVEEFVEHLTHYMEKRDLELVNHSSNTALCLFAAAGNLKLVKIMVEKNRALVAITGSQEMTPLYMAAMFGNYEVVKYLYENSRKLRDDCWTPQNRGWLLLKCVETDMFDIAVKIVKEHPELGSSGSVLGVLARKTNAFAETESNIITRTINWVFTVISPNVRASEKQSTAMELLKIIWLNMAEKPKNIIDEILRGPPDPPIEQDGKPTSNKEDQTLQLLKLMSDNMVKMQKIKEPAATSSKESYVINANKKYSSRILFVASEVGNTRFVVELIRQYPDLIWKVNDDNQCIFHVAARHRQVGIYNLLHEIGSKKDLITPIIDKNGNNMLHLVGKSVKRKRLEDVSGAAFQMQRELLWFKEVAEMIPHSYREHRNADGLTPRELFTKEHEDLVVQGEEWMKGTASQCMVVAALIATIVFAAAFTVPGGYNQNNGIPFFYRKVCFIVFVVADAISLFTASASILTFLSILTSRYAERDFLESLPRKLMLGLATLYLSITTMTITFSVNFFALYHEELKWIPILIALLATMPVLLFATLQYRLLKDVIHSTYGSRYLFQPKKHVLYSDNSRSKHRCFQFAFPSKILKLL